jgi:2,4-dienoyl-CoA reductase-like NADH-dependent reductase (Old Yellow Enzyme family)
MHDLDQARRVLHDGHADLLSLGTGALANPDLPLRLSRGVPLDAFDPGMIHPDVTLGAAESWRRAV